MEKQWSSYSYACIPNRLAKLHHNIYGVTIDTKKQVSLRATEVIITTGGGTIATEIILPPKTASLWESAKRDHLGAYTEGRRSAVTERLGLGSG